MNIQRTTKFLLHIRHKDDTKASIRMRLTLRGESPIDFPMRLDVLVSDWDVSRQCAFPMAANATTINRTIEEWKSIVDEIFARFELIEKRIPTLDEIKDLFNERIGRTNKFPTPDITKNLFFAFDRFTQTMGAINNWSDGTLKKFTALQHHLRDFDPNLSLEHIDEEKMQAYLAYLTKRGFKNTTINKDISYFQWFLRWAASKGYYQGEVHRTFKPKLKGANGNTKEIIYLTQDEIRTLQIHNFENPFFSEVRDVFLFCCFTGLRYSDVAKLKKTDVKDGYIDVVTQKTIDGLRIELNKHSRAILDKYKDIPLKGGLALPITTNQQMNEALKLIGQECEITEPIRIVYFQGNQRHEDVYPKWALLTTHCGRRTFVVMALRLGIPAEVIMKWTGHKDFDAMKPYVKIVDELKKQEMSRFDLI